MTVVFPDPRTSEVSLPGTTTLGPVQYTGDAQSQRNRNFTRIIFEQSDPRTLQMYFMMFLSRMLPRTVFLIKVIYRKVCQEFYSGPDGERNSFEDEFRMS